MKTCKVCKVEKGLDEFWANKRYKDQKHPWCKTCFTSYSRERMKIWRLKKKEEALKKNGAAIK